MIQKKGLMTHRKSELKKPKVELRWPQPTDASGSNQRIKALRQDRRAIKEETIAIDREWVHNQTVA